MTTEEIKRAGEVMIAFAEGKKIEVAEEGRPWRDCDVPSFNWDSYNYRIKPEPKYRPFKTQEECWNEMHNHPDFGWVKRVQEPAYLSLNKIEEIGRVEGWNFEDIFDKITFTDGEPFGIKEE